MILMFLLSLLLALVSLRLQEALADGARDHREGAFHGCVVDEDGRAVTEARIVLLDRVGAFVSGTTSDARGRFLFESRPSFREFTLRIEAQGYLPVERTTLACRETSVELERAGTLSGVVVDASSGTPLAGLHVCRNTRKGSSSDVLTDAAGRFVLELVPAARPFVVLIRRPGALVHEELVTATPAGSEALVIRLPRGVPIVLEAFEWETDVPIVDAAIDVDGTTLVTDARGRVELLLPDSVQYENTRLSIGRSGWCTTERFVPPSELSEPLRIPLSRGARVVGWVETEDGLPILGAAVSAEDLPPPEDLLVPDALLVDGALSPEKLAELSGSRLVAGRELPARTTIHSGARSTTSDAAGRFELAGLPCATSPRSFTASAPGRVRARAEATLSTNDREHHLVLRLPRGVTVRGIVTRDGEPAIASVRWWTTGASGEGLTDDRGAFELRGIPAGEIEIEASESASGTWHALGRPLRLVDGQESEVIIEVPPPQGTISGRVVDAASHPQPGVHVHASPFDMLCTYGMHLPEATTAADGSFSLEIELGQGPFRVLARKGLVSVEEGPVLLGTSSLRLVLEQVGAVSLLPLEADTRRPVLCAQFLWRSSDERPFDAELGLPTPDPLGSVLLEMPVGIVDLVLVPESLEIALAVLRGVEVHSGGEAARVEVLFPPATGLTIRLLGKGGAPRPPRGAVWLVDERLSSLTAGEPRQWVQDMASLVLEKRCSARVASDGIARFRGLAPGRYWFHCAEGDAAFEPPFVDVPAPGTVAVSWTSSGD